MNERIEYTPDGKGFILNADDYSRHEVKNFADVYDKEKFLDLMKKGGKARDWVARHNTFGYYVKKRDADGNVLSDADAQLQALPRYMTDESWYDEDNYFWIQIDGFSKPLICQLRISNHNTSHSQYESSHSNDKSVDCQTCLNVIIGDTAYNRDKFDTHAKGKDAIVSVETFFDEDKRTPEQIKFFENFVEKVRKGAQPSITMAEIRKYIDPKARIVISQNGKETTASLANIRPSQYSARKNRVVNRLKTRAWTTKTNNNNFEIPKAIPFSVVTKNQTGEKYTDKDGEYDIFLYNDRRFAFSYDKFKAYYIKTNGNLSKDNEIEILDENRRRRHNILEDKNMKILVKRNNKLLKLGEGRIYSKSQLRLHETITVGDTTSNDEQINGAGDLERKVNQGFATDSKLDAQTVPMDSIGHPTQVLKGSGTVLQTDQKQLSQNKAQYANLAQQMPGAKLKVLKGNALSNGDNTLSTESRVIEMRKSSIPFTKKELSDFLSTL